MVGNLGRAVIGHVADQDIARRRGGTVELVVTDPHADDRPQPGKALQIGAADAEAHDHQPVGLGAIRVGQFRQCAGVALHDVEIAAEDPALQFIGLLARFGIEHGHGHRLFLRLSELAGHEIASLRSQ